MMIDTIQQYLALRPEPPFVVSGKHRTVGIPCANTLIVARGLVQANTYNPNSVSDDKMELLRQSIVDNGFCFPIVTIYDPELEKFVVIDGFHRYLISGPDWLGMRYVPIVVLQHDADLIRALIQQGVGEDEIATRLGIDLDTVLRYKQLTGIAELFKNASYSMSWEMTEVPNEVAIR